MSMLIKDFKLFFADRGSYLLIVLLAAGLACALLFGKPLSLSPKIGLGIVDLDRTEYSEILISYFSENEVFNEYITVLEGDESMVRTAFASGEIDLYVVIPEFFSESLMHINNDVGMKAVINSSDITKSVVLKELLNSYASYISAVEVNCQSVYDIMSDQGIAYDEVSDTNVELSYDLIFTALGKDSFFNIKDNDRISGVPLVNYYVYSLLALIILYAGVFTGADLLKERLCMVSVRLKANGVSGMKMILSKALSHGIVVSVLLIAACILMTARSELSFEAGEIAFIVFSVFVSCLLGAAVSLVFKSSSSYMIFANMLVLFMCIAGGGVIPIMYLPEAMLRVARFTPNYWFIRMLV